MYQKNAWLEYDETALCEMEKFSAEYRRFLEGNSLLSRPVEALKASEILNALLDIATQEELDLKRFRSVKGIVNAALDLAVLDDMIRTNPARQIRGLSSDILKQPDDKPAFIEEIICL